MRGEVLGYVEEDRGYSTKCWIWKGYINRDGYGRIKISRALNILAHRRYYIEIKGQIPAGYEIDHLCRVRSCVNPEHLEAVSHAVNAKRGWDARKGRI